MSKIKAHATPSQFREQGRSAFALFGYYAHNPYAPRIENRIAFGEWFEGWAQAEWAHSFRVYLKQIRKFCEADCEPDAWIDEFNDGLSPAEARACAVQSGD